MIRPGRRVVARGDKRGTDGKNAMRERLRNQRRYGRVDAFDLVLGITAAIVLPLIAYAVMVGLGMAKTRSEVGEFREKIQVEAEPDAELIGLKLAYLNQIFQETALGYERARQAESSIPQQLRLKDWKDRCLRSLITTATTAEAEIVRHGLEAKLAGPLGNLRNFLQTCRTELASGESGGAGEL